MPAKQKHSRRKISPRIKSRAAPRSGIVASFDSGIANPPNKITSSSGPELKTSAASELDSSVVYKEIKWIGIVTAIVIVVLVISYIFLH